MALIVKKFGGSSVANVERVMNVANKIVNSYKEGNKVVVVLSAQGDTTDHLIDKAHEILPNPSKREMDMLLATGEQISIAILAMAIQRLGYPVVSLTGFQVGIKTNDSYSNARIERIDCERLKRELDDNKIVIVAGFQGIDKHGNITTLGRGGSDTTAVAIAAAINADYCEIFTDVDGIYTSDPNVVEDARKLDVLSYDETLELASLGARVLHNRSVELAKKYNVKLIVRSSLHDVEGTVVMEVENMEKTIIKGVAYDLDVARVSVLSVKDIPGIAYKLFKLLADAGINVDIILQSVGRDGTKDITFTVSCSVLQETLDIIENNLSYIGAEGVSHSEDMAKISIVGAGMAIHPGIAATMFEALAEESININMISTSEIKISCLVNREDAEKATKAIHKKFRLHEIN